MFVPWNRGPSTSTAPPTWQQNTNPTKQPGIEEIRRHLRVDYDAAKKYFDEFANYSAQRLAEYDQRGRERLAKIGDEGDHELPCMKEGRRDAK